MKRLVFLIVVILCSGILIPLSSSCTTQNAPDIISSNTTHSLNITINGLAGGDEAILTISPETDTRNILFSQSVRWVRDGRLVETISFDLKDGYYLLLLETSGKYYRDPKGYFFMVEDSEIFNPQNRKVVFNLKPPSEFLEPYVSLYSPPKTGPSEAPER